MIETGTGVSVIPAAQWQNTYPDVYESYMANKSNEEIADHVTEYPMIVKIYEGNAFGKFYGSARGHFYCIEDVKATGRPHTLANCFTCKTADFTAMTVENGVSAYSLAFDDIAGAMNEDVGCYTCHAADPANGLTVTHLYLAESLGGDMSSVAGANAVCAQCHVEYYFDPETKATSLPYTSLSVATPEQMYDYYEAMDFADYTNPRTGVRQLKAQHPEFETYLGAGSIHAGTFTCADCHMETVTREDGTTYRSHFLISPLKSETIQKEKNCASCHTDLTGFVQGIQEKMEARTIEIGGKLAALDDKLASAVESGKYSEEQLYPVRALNRKGQWFWDFVFVENSEGAHNTRLDNRCLDLAEAFIDAASGLLDD